MKKICIFVSCFFMIFSFSFCIINVSASSVDLKNRWYTERTFPMNPDSPEWMDYGLAETLDILNPPEDLLKEMTTEELANLMMNYPHLWVLTSYEFDKKDIFWGYLSNNCSIYNELLSREDGIECLMSEYLKTDFDANMYNENPYIVYGYDRISNSEVFGCQLVNHMISNLSEYSQYWDILNKVIAIKNVDYSLLDENDAKAYLSFNDGFTCDANNTDDISIADIVYDRTTTSDGFTATGSPYVRSIEGVNIYFTPGIYHRYGTDSTCLQWYSGDYTNEKREALHNGFTYFSNWYRLAQATPKYNCHGYAWLNPYGPNGYWIDPPILYMSYGNVTNITAGSEQVGDIIVMYNSSGVIVHSAIVCPTPSGGSGEYTVSKMGGRGLYRAPLSEVMSYYLCTSYSVYRT